MQDQKLKELINEMTLSEKIGQLVQITGDFFNEGTKITGPMQMMNLTTEEVNNVGSVIGVVDHEQVRHIQDVYLKENRLKIPLMFMSDVVHGANTIFPIPLGLSSSFDEDLVEDTAKYAAKEAYVQGCNVTFAPMADLAIDARWGRNMESCGEDTYLSKKLTAAYVRGFQQKAEDGTLKLASCIKHFAGYGLAQSGREYNTVDVSKRFLKEFHYPIYKEGIDAGARMVMTAFNPIDSIPAVGNASLIKKDLRKGMNFNDPIISDWGAVKELIEHKVASNEEEAALKSLKATCDIDMMTPCYQKSTANLIAKGLYKEEELDEAVYRILKLKKDLGLFDNPYGQIDEAECKKFILGEEILNLAKKAADKSVVLLKNDNKLLPLDESNKVLICGPLANTRELMGPWSIYGDKNAIKKINEYFEATNENVKYVDYETLKNDVEMIEKSDKIIFFGGETSFESGEAHSKTNIKVDDSQVDLLKTFKQFGKEVVYVNFSGRPVDLTDVVIYADSIVQAWFLGTMTAQSLYDIIYGKVNPSGKLTMTFPRSVGQCPISYKDFPTGRPKEKAIDEYTSKYIDCSNEPLFYFGAGLNYSDVVINDVKCLSKEFNLGEKLEVVVSLENKSDIKCEEVIQLYINDLVAEVIRPVKELKAFKRIELGAFESKEVTFEIDESMLSYINYDGELQVDSGDFEIMIGLDSVDLNVQKIKLKK